MVDYTMKLKTCREKEVQEKNVSRRAFFYKAMSLYFPSNAEEIVRGKTFVQAMTDGTLTNELEFQYRDVCLLVHTISYNPAFVVYPLSDLTEGNYWGILGELTNIHINVISADRSDLRPMTASGWGAAVLGTIVAFNGRDKQVTLLVNPTNCIITER